jgi:hypothetical protein
MMKFSVLCMTDGAVEVTLDDLNAVVFEGQEDVQLVFSCPVCGEEIRLGVHIPNLYVAASGLAELLEEAQAMRSGEGEAAFQVFNISHDESSGVAEPRIELLADDDPRVERYVEYFRRQLAECDNVEAFLAEVDEK